MGLPAEGATPALRSTGPPAEHGRQRRRQRPAVARRGAAARRRSPVPLRERGERGARGGGRGVGTAAAGQGEGPAERVEGQAG